MCLFLMILLSRLSFILFFFVIFLFQAEDGIRYLVRSRGLGDVYKRQARLLTMPGGVAERILGRAVAYLFICITQLGVLLACLLYTSDAADERSSVDLGGRRIIKKKTVKLNKNY